jgi:hypothetical protein
VRGPANATGKVGSLASRVAEVALTIRSKVPIEAMSLK